MRPAVSRSRAALLVVAWCLSASAEAGETAELDLSRYLGVWYVQAQFPSVFQKGCMGTTATYLPSSEPGEFKIKNRCRKDSLSAPETGIDGKAWTPDPQVTGKLKVQFFWPFFSDLWVLDVAPDYTWALVGNPKKTSVWVFTRTPHVEPSLYLQLVANLKARGYAVERLIRVPQALAEAPK